MPNIAVTFMDNSIAYFHTGDGPGDYYSWKIDTTGLVFSRHTKGERTHIPWHNIKYFDVEIPGAPLREPSPMQMEVKYGVGSIQLPNNRCKAGRVVRRNSYSPEEEVRCFKPEDHYNIKPEQVRNRATRHSAVTPDGEYEVHWFDGQEVPEIHKLKT